MLSRQTDLFMIALTLKNDYRYLLKYQANLVKDNNYTIINVF